MQTARMHLLPATVGLARAELSNREMFAKMLGAIVPPNWPPETLADALPFFLKLMENDSSQVGWLVWYALFRDPALSSSVLVGAGGFRGPPLNGMVEIGYSVLPQFQRLGFATEMVGGLLDWAFQQPGVQRVIAETESQNAVSMRVLEKHGFVADGLGSEPNHLRFAVCRSG